MSKKIRKPSLLIISFLLGIIAGFYLKIDERFVIIAGILCLVVLAFRYYIALSICLLVFLGAFYIQIFIQRSQATLAEGCYEGRTVTIPVEISNGYLSGFETNSQVRVVVKTQDDVLEYQQRSKICFDSGQLEKVSGGYGAYLLSRFQTSSMITEPKIDILSQSYFWKNFFSFKESIIGKMKRVFIGDKGVLAVGLLLGGSQDFSDGFVEAMKGSGTSHLVAVSGYNVSIITIVIFGLVRSLFSRRSAFASTLVILVCFCLLTGASASVVRAAIMGGTYLLSKALGRRVSPLHMLSMAAFIMVLVNPFAIFDVGFQLSFAATFGLISAIDIFGAFTKTGFLNQLLLVIPETVVAQIFTLPVMLYHFGQTSLISIIPNTLILPLVPLAMFFIFLAIISAGANIYLGMLVGICGEIFLRYFIFIIRYFGSLPFAQIKIEHFSIYMVAISYCLILLSISLLCKKINEKVIKQDA